MSDLKEQARKLADKTRDRLAFRLNEIWRKWGPRDFPEDNGVGFRNEIFLFSDWMLYIFKQACSGDPENPKTDYEWIDRNAEKFLELSSKKFLRCIGISSIHMRAFWWHLHFLHNPSMPYNQETTKQKLLHFGKQLDWIYIAHDLPEDAPKTAYALLVKHMGEEGFIEASKEQMGLYLAKTPLGWSEASSPDRWDHWACGASLTSQNLLVEEAAKTQRYCDQVFTDD